MSKFNPTPGPWRVSQPSMGFSSLTGINGELIFGLAAGDAEEKQPDDVCDANARLLEASRSAYDLLKKIDDYLQSRQKGQINTISTSSVLANRVRSWVAEGEEVEE